MLIRRLPRHPRLRRRLRYPKLYARKCSHNFDRYASLRSLHRPPDALATSPKAGALPFCATPRYHIWLFYYVNSQAAATSSAPPPLAVSKIVCSQILTQF